MWCELCVVSAPEIPEYPNSNFWATREMTAHGYDTDDENTHLRPHQKVSLLSRPPLSARKRKERCAPTEYRFQWPHVLALTVLSPMNDIGFEKKNWRRKQFVKPLIFDDKIGIFHFDSSFRVG